MYASFCSSIGLFLGISNVDNHGGCGGLWFIVTLLLLKVIFQQITPLKETILTLGMVPLIFFTREAIIDTSYEFFGFSFLSVFIAYPFFLIGYLLSIFFYDKIFVLSSLLERKYRKLSFGLGVIVLTLLYVVSPINGVVYMIYGGWGNHFAIFILYSIIGIMGVYFLALYFSCRKIKWVTTISVGSIVILAFQGYFIERIAPRLETLCLGKNNLYECCSVVASVIIMFVFIPIIKLCQRYFPMLLGKR